MTKKVLVAFAIIASIGTMGVAVNYTATAEDTIEVRDTVAEVAVVEDNSTSGDAISSIDDLSVKKAELIEAYKNEIDSDKRTSIAEELIDIDYSFEWYGICTSSRFLNKDTYEQNGYTNWVEGSIAFDKFTGEFIDATIEVKTADLSIF